MARVLLLLPTRTYRAAAFLAAAEHLGVQVTVVSEEPSTLVDRNPAGFLTLAFHDLPAACATVAAFSRKHAIDAVIPVDDDTAVTAAAIAEALQIPHNSLASTESARNKYRMRQILEDAGIPIPRFKLLNLEKDPQLQGESLTYPCVLKPLCLSASRGVMRVDSVGEFVTCRARLKKILRQPDIEVIDQSLTEQALAESFIPGREVALEGLLTDGRLQVLALFDKPDPLDGPFFEETIYVTPSRLATGMQEQIAACTAQAANALGLRQGPIHAELRVNEKGPWLIEIGARSIGGLCSRVLHFGTGHSLEAIILRHALGQDVGSFQREDQPAGVMMVPIPRRGVLESVGGLAAAKDTPDIEDVVITAHPGMELIPLPEGSRYLGFLFSRAATPAAVETALREAHTKLDFVIRPKTAVVPCT